MRRTCVIKLSIGLLTQRRHVVINTNNAKSAMITSHGCVLRYGVSMPTVIPHAAAMSTSSVAFWRRGMSECCFARFVEV